MDGLKDRRFRGNQFSIKWSLLLAWLILAAAVTLMDQSTATITGLVYDSSRAVVPGAQITLIDENSGDLRKTTSNEEGYFTFSALVAKTYRVQVELSGFKTWERVGVVVHPGDKINISDIVMTPGVESQTITVSSEAGEMITVD
jgi:hypothetical protein